VQGEVPGQLDRPDDARGDRLGADPVDAVVAPTVCSDEMR